MCCREHSVNGENFTVGVILSNCFDHGWTSADTILYCSHEAIDERGADALLTARWWGHDVWRTCPELAKEKLQRPEKSIVTQPKV